MKEIRVCKNCPELISRQSKGGLCRSCSNKTRRIIRTPLKCLDCPTILSRSAYYAGNVRCRKCASQGELNSNYKHGKTISNKCLDCPAIISSVSLRCAECNGKFHSGTNGYNYGRNMKTGRKLTQTHKDKCSKALTGRIPSEEARSKQSLAMGGTGIPYENRIRYPSEFYAIRESILIRDNYTCQECGITAIEHKITYNVGLSVHHVDYIKDHNVTDNLICLCSSCHAKTNTESQKSYWIIHFRKKLCKLENILL